MSHIISRIVPSPTTNTQLISKLEECLFTDFERSEVINEFEIIAYEIKSGWNNLREDVTRFRLTQNQNGTTSITAELTIKPHWWFWVCVALGFVLYVLPGISALVVFFVQKNNAVKDLERFMDNFAGQTGAIGGPVSSGIPAIAPAVGTPAATPMLGAPAVQTVAPSNDMSQLKELAQLKEQGIITEVEFTEKKRLILGLSQASGPLLQAPSSEPISPNPPLHTAAVIKSSCPNCGKVFEVPESFRGQQAACSCGSTITVN
jgi:hypothetical protein